MFAHDDGMVLVGLGYIHLDSGVKVDNGMVTGEWVLRLLGWLG